MRAVAAADDLGVDLVENGLINILQPIAKTVSCWSSRGQPEFPLAHLSPSSPANTACLARGTRLMQRLYRRLAMNRFVVLGRVGMDLYADPPGTEIGAATRFFSAPSNSAVLMPA